MRDRKAVCRLAGGRLVRWVIRAQTQAFGVLRPDAALQRLGSELSYPSDGGCLNA